MPFVISDFTVMNRNHKLGRKALERFRQDGDRI